MRCADCLIEDFDDNETISLREEDVKVKFDPAVIASSLGQLESVL